MQLFYRKFGTGQPFIILHGLFGQSDNWQTIAKKLGDTGYEVYAIDQRNHGLSPHSNEWNYQEMSHDLSEFILTHDLENPIVMGHSMGGKVAMQFAVDHPLQLGKLIVVDIAPKFYPTHHDAVLTGLTAVDFNKIKSRKEAEQKLNEYIPDFGTRQFLLKNLYWKDMPNGEKELDWRFNLDIIQKNIVNVGEETLVAPFADQDALDELPVLFIKGEKSAYILDEDKTLITKIFAKATVASVPDAGHWIHADKPEEVLKIILDFVRNEN